jgi:hypothetical protein
LFAADELFGVEKLAIRASPDLIQDGRLKVDINRSRDVFSLAWSQKLRCGEGGYQSRRRMC